MKTIKLLNFDTKHLKRHFMKEDTWMLNKYTKDYAN